MKKTLKQVWVLPAALSLLSMIPFTAHAQAEEGLLAILPVEMSLTTFLIIGGLLVGAILSFFMFQARFNTTHQELKDITAELDHTRERLTESNHSLNKTEQDLKNTTHRYQNILFDAQVGMFQMDLDGKCTYINSVLQELSGLYPKKALKEGLQSAIHSEDRESFNTAWKTFIDGEELFVHFCRFKHAKGAETHVVFRANKVMNERKDVDSYIGWVSDVTHFHEEQLQQEAVTARYAQFVDKTIEGYYQLTPETPIPLTTSPDKMAAVIMEKMKLTACNETFAAFYGASTSSLKGKNINALQDGCGPFKNNETIKQLIDGKYKLVNFESVRQDPRGNRLNLMNNVVGLIEDNKLVGIWGSQRNISQQKREKEELTSQAEFMHRILNTLPADVHVKDTRCRYLYASQKLAERTGIPQESWVGKTIFEVMPATPRDHDKNAIGVMKTGKLARVERPYDARKKSGWMETIQIPLVSDDGLVEVVVGLSLEISERKKKEEELTHNHQQLEKRLKLRTTELQKTQGELGQTAITLRDANQKLAIRDAELENNQHEFREQLSERKRSEELLRKNETCLLTRQKQLEQQLSIRLSELESETDKRKKWEELITIKESELRKLEEISMARKKQLEEEIAQREQTAANLIRSQSELEKVSKELNQLSEENKQEVASLLQTKKHEFTTENTARKTAESHLKKTEALLQQTQERVKTLTEQHAAELEHEIAERKIATKKLIQNTDELDLLNQEYNERIEQETKMLKQELAKKQIREKALRQQEKDLETRITELEKTLQIKALEHNKQIQAREGAEVERKHVEQKLELMNTRQSQLVERETQKLNLNIAEIRLDEIKLRKKVGDLQQAKEDLEKRVETRTSELAKANKQQQETAASLVETQKKMKDLSQNQADLVAQEGEALQNELKQLKKNEYNLNKEGELLQKQGAELENTIRSLNEKLKIENQYRNKVETDLKDLQIAFDASQDNVSALLEQHTKELQEQIVQHKKNETAMQKTEATLKKQADQLQQTIDLRTNELADTQEARKKTETELTQAIERASLSSTDTEVQIAKIKKSHVAEINKTKDEQKELRKSEKQYRSLFQSSADAFLQINPKNGKIQSANLAAAHLFGEETAEALANKTLESLSPEQQPNRIPSPDMAKARLHSTLETGHDSFEWQFNHTDKTAFHALVSLSTIRVGESQHILAVVQNISEIKQRQDDLQQAIEEAHSANRINSQIVDELNEAIQTSLHPVVQSSSAIEKSENLSVEEKLQMAVIHRNSRTLIDMMNYRSELSHVADGSDDYTSGKCDLHELIQNLDQQFSQRAETKKLFFAVSYAQYQSSNNVPKLVETDEYKINKVLSTLLGYAMAHTGKGRLGLHASQKSSKEDNTTVTFELTYTGSQQKDELLSRIFSPENADTENALDMKYGLSLARRYIRLLNGEIELEYREGGVTALSLEFPFKKVLSEIVMPNQEDEKEAGAA